tara:strand:+ start:85 stop:276 length:192 start_codon:yes stop_codon:yes gene_type:complete
MKCKAKKSYTELPNTDNFLAKGSASTHLLLVAGRAVEITKDLLPLSKKLGECLEEIKDKKEKK